MNISDFIKPTVTGKPGINDNKWIARISKAKRKEDIIRVEFKNSYQITTITGLKKRNSFKVIFFIDEKGGVNYKKITISSSKKYNNQKHKQQTIDELGELFSDLKKLNCTI